MLQNKNQVSKGEIQLWLKVKPDFSFIPSMENAFIENYTRNLNSIKNTPWFTFMIHVLYSLWFHKSIHIQVVYKLLNRLTVHFVELGTHQVTTVLKVVGYLLLCTSEKLMVQVATFARKICTIGLALHLKHKEYNVSMYIST